jgi:hypothetical protein
MTVGLYGHVEDYNSDAEASRNLAMSLISDPLSHWPLPHGGYETQDWRFLQDTVHGSIL